MVRWIIGLIVVIVVAVVGYNWYSSNQMAEQAKQAADQAATAAQEAAQKAGEAAQQAATAAQDAASTAAATATAAVASVTESLKSLSAGGVDVGGKIGGAVDSLTATLGGITDTATGQAAKAKLEEAQKALTDAGASVDQLPADGRKLLATTLAAAMPAIKAAADKVTAIEGVGAELKPTIDSIIATLDTWSKAPA